jgi:hypothetical protein
MGKIMKNDKLFLKMEVLEETDKNNLHQAFSMREDPLY